ncbi:MAG: hypothetical protein QMD13_04605 [Candidatus Bathyarchaeia archaeon]|nr:hypothetical protein [Candidatus Bathyarchaeia archaeon]
MPIFQQSVDAELYEWLLKEQKRRKARSIQEANLCEDELKKLDLAQLKLLQLPFF